MKRGSKGFWKRTKNELDALPIVIILLIWFLLTLPIRLPMALYRIIRLWFKMGRPNLKVLAEEAWIQYRIRHRLLFVD